MKLAVRDGLPPPIVTDSDWPWKMEKFLRGLKSGGCKAKKVGGVNTQNTPGFGTPAADLSLPHVAVYEILKKDLIQSGPQLLGTSPALREEQEGESGVLPGTDYAVPDLWIRVS